LFGEGEEGEGQMAIAVGVLVEVVLMIFFGFVEVLQRLLLDNEGLLMVLLLLGKHFLYDG
jgi:hypothetical protein